VAIQKKNQLVGLDIGCHSIKLVEIDHARTGLVLKNLGIIGLPPNAIVEGTIKEPEVVVSAIKNLFKNLKVRNKNVAISISGYSVIVKKIALEKKEDSELEAVIYDEAEQYIPFDINEVNLDFDILTILNDSSEEEGAQITSEGMDVMLVAAKKDFVDDYVSLVKASELNPIVMDVDSFALQNALELGIAEQNNCYAIVNIGAEELGINAVKNGISLFTRDSSYGGSEITREIMSEFNITFEEAEKIKLTGTKVDKEKKSLEEIFSSVVSGWVQEIKRALDFVANTYPDESIEKIYVCGGSARISGFRKYLERETTIPVFELNPFENLMVNEKLFDTRYIKYMAPQVAVAVGLALRTIGDK